MKWKQFFTPVNSINGQEARQLVDTPDGGEVLYLDVRQPKEYERGHLPGAKLIPIGDLERRLAELDPEQPTIIY